mgnify:FL=1
MAKKWLATVLLSLVIFIFALYTNNFILYAVSYAILASAQLALSSDVEIAKKFSSTVIGKLISLKYNLIDLTKVLIFLMAIIAFITHRDFTTLFYLIYFATMLLLVFLKVPFERLILAAALFSAGIIGNYSIAVSEKPLTLKALMLLLVNSFTVPSVLYLIKAYREARGKTFLLTGQIVAIGLILVGLFPIMGAIAFPAEIYWKIVSVLGGLIVVSSLRYLLMTLAGRLWTTQMYYGDMLYEAADILSRILQQENIVYSVKEPKSILATLGISPPQYEFIISSPFRAKIVLRKWIHRARVRSIPMKVGEPGLVISIMPGPKKADPRFKKIVAEFLERLNISSLDWKT